MKQNPIGWVITLIGLAYSAYTMFSKKQEEATTAEGEFQEATKKSGDELRTYMSVLQRTESGTTSHRKALEKINAMCQEYNKTLLDENSTLDQQKAKYEELTRAVQSATAEKIKAKYVEQAMSELTESQNNATDKLKDRAGKAGYKQKTGTKWDRATGDYVDSYTEYASENIRNASGAVWDAVEAMALESANKLKDLTGSAYNEAFNKSLQIGRAHV